MFSDALKQKQYINSRDVADILPEAYTLDYDPVIVVSGYKILSKESIGVGPTCVMVQYTTLATTKGRGTPLQSRSGFRLFYPLLIPKIDIVNFCVVASNDGYVLIDPPVPRVGLASLVEFYTKKLARAEKRLAEVSVKDVYAKRNIVEMCDYYKRQLKVLNKLSQRA